MCLKTGTPKIINFPFGTNGKLMVLGVPIFKHFRVDISIVSDKTMSRYFRESFKKNSENFEELSHSVF